MNIRFLLITFILTFTLAACDSAEEVAGSPEATPATEEVTESEGEEAIDEAEEIEAINEAAEEAAEETPEAETDTAESDEIVLITGPEETREWKYKEGVHYRKMASSQGTSSAPDKIEVAEVFWYGCPHCYDFDPILEDWKTTLAPDVAFVRIPVIWNPTNQLHARIMYTADALGKLPEVHAGVFMAIHQDGNTLTKEDDLIEFFAQYGVSEEEFREAYNSFAVNSSVKRAENLTRRYGVRSVPVLIINGKYATDGEEVKTFGDMINVTNELIERERAE